MLLLYTQKDLALLRVRCISEMQVGIHMYKIFHMTLNGNFFQASVLPTLGQLLTYFLLLLVVHCKLQN